MISGSWFRTAPEDSSTPLHTRSYWSAVMVRGSISPARPSSALPGRRRAWRRGCGRIPARRIPPRSRTWGSPRSSRIRSAPVSMWLGHRRCPALRAARRRSSGRRAFLPAAHSRTKVSGFRSSAVDHLPSLLVAWRNLAMPPARSRPCRPPGTSRPSCPAWTSTSAQSLSIGLAGASLQSGHRHGLDHVCPAKGPKPQSCAAAR